MKEVKQKSRRVLMLEAHVYGFASPFLYQKFQQCDLNLR